MFLSSAWDQHLPLGFIENQPVLAHTLNLNLIIHPMSKKKKKATVQSLHSTATAMCHEQQVLCNTTDIFTCILQLSGYPL
jgi:predicted metal-dependent TIM-barrel fold hydrolase